MASPFYCKKCSASLGQLITALGRELKISQSGGFSVLEVGIAKRNGANYFWVHRLILPEAMKSIFRQGVEVG